MSEDAKFTDLSICSRKDQGENWVSFSLNSEPSMLLRFWMLLDMVSLEKGEVSWATGEVSFLTSGSVYDSSSDWKHWALSVDGVDGDLAEESCNFVFCRGGLIIRLSFSLWSKFEMLRPGSDIFIRKFRFSEGFKDRFGLAFL